ncbi:MAG: hypothetical protein AAFN30_19165, partial [Actinomycetota bacterium]
DRRHGIGGRIALEERDHVEGLGVVPEGLAVRALHRATRRFRDVMWVYAGRVVLTTAVSRQIGPVDWDAVVVHQFPSATDHRMVARSLAYQEALSAFPRSYAHGFRRWRTVNVLAPQVIGLRRAMRRIRREPDLLPFRPRACGHDDADLGRSGSLDKLLTEPLDTEGAVAFSLLAGGEGDHRGAGCRTAMSMLELMAEARFGPTHLGPAVAVEGDARFDAVAAVCYPSLEFVADMAGSEFFRRMAAGNQMDDLHSVVTVPILHRL